MLKIVPLGTAPTFWNPLKGMDINSYKNWLSGQPSSEQEEKIFRSSASIIGSEDFKRKHVMQRGHAILRRRGRARRISISI